MKYLKILGLAAVAAMAAMAVLGASTASATTICETNTLPCSPALGAGTRLKAELTEGNEAVLTAGLAVIKCRVSVITGRTTNGGGGAGTPVAGEITGATWTSCECNLGSPVETGALNTPWSAELNYTSEMNGTLKVANPEGFFKCGSTKCVYGTTSASTTVKGGSPARVEASVGLERKPGSNETLCAKTATWKAVYTVVEPTSLWVANS